MQTAKPGVQAVREGWNADAARVELPLSVESVVDLTWTRQHFHFREEALDRIDRIVQ